MSLLAMPRASRESRIDQSVDIDALEVFANERQSGVGTQVVGQSFDKKSVLNNS